MEILFDKYSQLLQDSTNPHILLLNFLCELHDVTPNFTQLHFQMMGKLVKLYGKNTVFYAIGATAFMEEFDLADMKMFNYLNAICLRKVSDNLSEELINLNEVARKKKIPKRKPKPKDPFEKEELG